MLKRSLLAFGAISLAVSGARAEPVTLEYWMWSAQQVEPYQQCIDKYRETHPDVTINISQYSFGDYWTALTTAFISGTAPDVFVNQMTRYPEFYDNGVLVNLQSLVERDNYDISGYRPGLVELWSDQEGDLYGMPKDWDTRAVAYNKDMTDAAGISKEEMDNLTWNPDDGGTFGEVIRKLALDGEGRDGTDPNFDENNVVRYGYVNNRFEGIGHLDWANLAYSNGFTHMGARWGSDWNYDAPELVETFQWLRSLQEEGVAIPASEQGDLGTIPLMTAEKGALAMVGNFQVNALARDANFNLAFAPVPKGPIGRRSALNGIADSIWVGTDNLEAAWDWVKFLGSPDCQNLIGATGIVFPAIPAASELSHQVMRDRNIDVDPFLTVANEEETFLYPVAFHGSEVLSIINPAIDNIFLGSDDIQPILKKANDEIESLY